MRNQYREVKSLLIRNCTLKTTALIESKLYEDRKYTPAYCKINDTKTRQTQTNYWAWNFESISFITGSSNFSSAHKTGSLSSNTKHKPVVGIYCFVLNPSLPDRGLNATFFRSFQVANPFLYIPRRHRVESYRSKIFIYHTYLSSR